jgi:DNA-3-methyladenine glycosylase II
LPKPIETEHDLARGLKTLVAADPRLAPIAKAVGPLPLRRREGGFEGLATIITAQQISDMAAAAIWGRLRAAIEPFTPEQFLSTPEEALRTAGLSGAKVRTLTGIAAAAADGFDLIAVHDLPAEEAVTTMTALKGIGPWTAEVYLLFCVGHPDVFPAGDLALRASVHHGLKLRQPPDEKKVRKLAERWSPWRGVAARLFWAYYRVRRDAAKAAKAAARAPNSGGTTPIERRKRPG